MKAAGVKPQHNVEQVEIKKAVFFIENHIKDKPDAIVAGMKYYLIPEDALKTALAVMGNGVQENKPAITVACEVTGLDEALEKVERLRLTLAEASALIEKMTVRKEERRPTEDGI